MKRRPLLFASAAAVGLWSAWIMLYGGPDASARAVASGMARKPAPPPVAATEPGARSTAQATQAARVADATPAPRPRIEAAPGDDAFAAREWFRPPPPPPTLPYRFVGMLDEGPKAKPRVFLSLGDKLLVAGVGDTLEGGYKLTAISGQELVFTHVQNNVTLKLVVAGGTS